jgi:cystathionine beta-lyase
VNIVSFDFDRMIDRGNTRSYKWDQSEKLFGHKDILPLWVADMDFESPKEAVEAIQKRAAEGIYGYTIRDEAYLNAIVNWFSRRHGWHFQKEWLTDTPGIVPALSVAVQAFTEKGGKVVIQSPVYYPFFDVIHLNDRELINSPLLEVNGRLEMDFDGLETIFKNGAKLMLLCNPHNPGGRVWNRADLEKLAALVIQYDVIVVSDEIHCDMILPGHTHIPFASLSEEVANRTITTLAPSKTFNLPGLQAAFTVISNVRLKRTFDKIVKALSIHMVNFFGPVATEACYTHGDAWLDALIAYIAKNANDAIAFMEQRLPELKPMRPEGTYLLWIDCRNLGLDVSGIKDLMFNQARVAFSEGSVFGPGGEGRLRINLACPNRVLMQALEQFATAVESRR